VEPKIVELDAFEVTGIAVVTNNQQETGGAPLIPKLWQQVIQGRALDDVPHKIEQNIYAVYTDYASDADGDYTIVIGAKCSPTAGTLVPPSLVSKTVPSGRYAVFTSARGAVAQVVVETWKQVWSYYGKPVHGQRAYRADFEIYDHRAADPNNAQVDIYIGVQ
jgi:predicted transcriptional regulator YdeE